jgi:hypothetical protein
MSYWFSLFGTGNARNWQLATGNQFNCRNQLRVAGCQLPILRMLLPVACRLFPVAGCRLLVASCQLPALDPSNGPFGNRQL